MKRAIFNLILPNQPTPKTLSNDEIAVRILNDVMKFRRTPRHEKKCGNVKCKKCASHHFFKVVNAVEKNQPVPFVLPAFPGKSPNKEKVLGVLPDYAEELSLQFLGSLCERIKTYYAPGIKVILCSDGRVFSDVIGIKEEHISAYQKELDRLIEKISLQDISTFNLDDYYGEINFIQMRKELMQRYGQSLDFLRNKVRNGRKESATEDEKEANRIYCGITRFLFEDAIFTEQTKSRSAVQREARRNAYEVIRRSNAWSELIADLFPSAVRLSIHPQTCGSKKLGIRLIADESWMTPWHGVAVETEKGPILLKRSEAQKLGAKLVYSEQGLPSHYRLLERE